MSPVYVVYAETFRDAIEGAREIEWGFTAADSGGEPELERTYGLDDRTKRELDGWLTGIASIGEREAAKRGQGFEFALGDGYYTKASGKQAREEMYLRVAPLAKDERRRLTTR